MSQDQYQLLLNALTRYDLNQYRKPHYNRYALPQYFQRLQEIKRDVEAGRSLRDAIIMGFCGHLQSQLLRAVGEPKARTDERNNFLVYQPAH